MIRHGTRTSTKALQLCTAPLLASRRSICAAGSRASMLTAVVNAPDVDAQQPACAMLKDLCAPSGFPKCHANADWWTEPAARPIGCLHLGKQQGSRTFLVLSLHPTALPAIRRLALASHTVVPGLLRIAPIAALSDRTIQTLLEGLILHFVELHSLLLLP